MRSVLSLIATLLLTASVCQADRPIFLVTPAGMYQSVVDSTGKPGAWVKISADVIFQGFPNNTPDNPIPPDNPPTDATVLQIAELSKTTLRNKDDATAVAAIIDSVAKLNLSATDFKQAIEMAAPIVDSSLSAGGRITDWSKKALAITSDPAKLKAGLISAWGVEQSTLDDIHAAATNPTPDNTARAVNWALIITIIQTILTLLKNLGIGGGT